jgi:hypothetical protein
MGFIVLEYCFAQSRRESDCFGRGRKSDGGGKLGEFTVLASVDFASAIVGGFAAKIKTKLVAIEQPLAVAVSGGEWGVVTFVRGAIGVAMAADSQVGPER